MERRLQMMDGGAACDGMQLNLYLLRQLIIILHWLKADVPLKRIKRTRGCELPREAPPSAPNSIVRASFYGRMAPH